MLLAQACESYKTDYGEYPQDKTPGQGSVTSTVDPTVSLYYNPQTYIPACSFLYVALSGDTNANGVIDHGERATPITCRISSSRRGWAKTQMCPTYIRDPYGNCYGYSTAGLLLDQEYTRASLATNPSATKPPSNSVGTVGYNSTFDLWSTGGTKGVGDSDTAKWIKNW